MNTGGISVIPRFIILVFTATIFCRVAGGSVPEQCELTFKDKHKVYYYSLASPVRGFPHGILSEDGFYKVAANGSVLWFQLCSSMIFNHDPPTCVDCKGCGGSSNCGMRCNALVSQRIQGYPVCTTLGQPSTTVIEVLDKNNPQMGVKVKMTNKALMHNCSLSVSVVCNALGVKGPHTLEAVGVCDFKTELKHPLGCAKIVSSHGGGLGWFGSFVIILLCLFGAYLVGGAAYRYFYLHVRGIDVIPNLEFWASLPHRIQSCYLSLLRRFRGPSHGYRSSYSPVNF
ncbi:uncharacterized protein LOC127256526 [Andrographis paniculata]|uniref:uncharacterized protein LOC127256526 n=1 Tax=Andrographis paniculata TaxID=175694 RepID=UPI0021E8CF6E|nr:uncharacterized protein LOC127256526 [Andrographis paniculata]